MHNEKNEKIVTPSCSSCGGVAVAIDSIESWIECGHCGKSTSMHCDPKAALQEWRELNASQKDAV